MSIWDSILRLFGQQPKPSAPSTAAKSDPATTLVLASEVGTPAIVPLDPFTHLFDKKDKHKTTMLNSITLSTDMKTLYLIDNGRAIPYDLTVPQGIMVGLLGDQLVVATGLPEPEDGGGNEPAGDLNEEKPGIDKITLKADAKSQFTLSYNSKSKAFGIIGSDDVVIHLQTPETGSCINKYFSLANRGIVKVQYTEEALTIEKIR
jgi:hypothetical protein